MEEIFVPSSKNLPACVAGWELGGNNPGYSLGYLEFRNTAPQWGHPPQTTDCSCTLLPLLILNESLSHHPKNSKIFHSCHQFSSQAKLLSQHKDYSGIAGHSYWLSWYPAHWSDLSRRAGVFSLPTVREKGQTAIPKEIQKARGRCQKTI